MDIKLLIKTIRYLTFTQIVGQVCHRLFNPVFRKYPLTQTVSPLRLSSLQAKWKSFDGATFTFLNIEDSFHDWNFAGHGPLWTYNLNYMDWLLQENMTFETGARWIDRFITDLPDNKIGLDPYPIALRGINWIKFISMHQDAVSSDRLQRWNDSLYSQYRLLERKLEYHLLGNHLLEDAYSLFIASVYFRDGKMYRKASKLLRQQLDEQILPDGAHYEQSPMYHCILLDRLLDCYNVSYNNPVFDGQAELTSFLGNKAFMMLGHLSSIIWSTGKIPLFNDSAFGIAPEPRQLFDYAERLGLKWLAQPMKECGYRKYSSDDIEAIADVGGITASYQPGHSHADTFNYELIIEGRPFIVDTGISTYNKTSRRQYERSTSAHNTVTVDDRNSSEVWGGFRVGDRAAVTITSESPDSITASHDGFGKSAIHTRRFCMQDGIFTVTDTVAGLHVCKNFIHFAPGVEVLSCENDLIKTNLAIIKISSADNVELIDGQISTEYNQFKPVKIAVMHFKHEMKYNIEIQ